LRISSAVMENFRGIRSGTLEDLDDAPLVILSGRNGVGKSLALLAVFLVWRGELDDNIALGLIGPWATFGKVELQMTFDDSEWQVIREFGDRLGEQVPPARHPVRLSLNFDNMNNAAVDQIQEPDTVRSILRNKLFRAENTFAQVDFIPAERQISRHENASPDPSALSRQSAEEWRASVASSLLGSYGPVTLFGVLPYLSALDYAGFLEERSGRETTLSGDYEEIAQAFRLATGKTIRRPQISGDGRIAVFVEAGDGNVHSLSLLSSGEQEALGLMYLVRRLRARGGILLIDEPEQHLHPSLQRTIVSSLERSSGHAQLWLSTHAPSLIASSSLDSVVAVYGPQSRAGNQFERVAFHSDRLDLLTELGMPPSAWQQGDFLLIVEGVTDERYLTRLLPSDLSRALILVAGNALGVERVSAALRGKEGVLPWVAVRDRDLASEEEVSRWKSADTHLHVWSRRAVESVFLDGPWISAVLQRSGVEWGADDIDASLAELAVNQRDEILSLLVERRLASNYAVIPTKKGGDLKSWYKAQAATAMARSEAYDEVLLSEGEFIQAEWDSRWREWVQAKRLLAEMLHRTPFRSLEHLIDAMIALAIEQDSQMPEDVTLLSAKFRSLI